jgi:hypothetical protein
MRQSNDEIENNIKKSSKHFMQYVWPIVGSWFGGGEIIPVEGVTKTHFAKELDQTAGIDAWQIFDVGGMKCIRGIASRVQWYRDDWINVYPFNTFTIRYKLLNGYKTEYDKRIYALKNKGKGILYPSFTIQAYLSYDGEPIYSVGAIKTETLFNAVSNHQWKVIPVKGGNEMLELSWYDLKMLGYKIKTYKKPPDKGR